MPIEFECDECSKKLRVRDDLAGKRAKCPACAAVLTVPAAPDEVEDEPARPARRQAIRARDDDERPAARRRPADDDEDDRRRRDPDDEDRDEEDEEERPRKKKRPNIRKKPSSWPLVLGLSLAGGAVLLLGGGGVLLWFLLSGGGGGAGNLTAFVPGDGQGFGTMRVGELWRMPGFKEGFEKSLQAQPPGVPNPVTMLQQNLGLTMADLERVTVVVGDAQADAVWFVVETTGSTNQSSIKSKFQNPADATHQGKTYTAGGFPGAIGRTAVHFAGSKMFVIGPEAGVRRALEVGAKRNAGPLDEGLALLAGGKQIVGAFNLPPAATTQLRQAVKNPFFTAYAPLAEVQGGTVAMAFNNRRVDFEASLKFPADAQAQAAKGAAQKGIPALRGLITLAKLQAQPGQGPGFDALEKGLNTVKIDQQGPRVVVTFSADEAMMGK